ncbi:MULTISPECIES: YlmC/YmxH family sporulation protein [unclassified Caloramator]|jgi:YlmC/YmxH family sporulation protein|uniref:YlmC/YmxH family sporulation protein n=1 Tax=unclassified Caloramator TaxID=2629145 RepID=UPI00237E56E9|nr:MULTISPECIES: YlmC/YmxH family sporulation protein [unclassified Caloramator]MCX7904383.1 YlmC/YmxH family sporulation protein [Caloramator sp.]MDO6355465.1 YlmC/YmxH family sporulation protein [Caloramator sp. CAR-1]WDU84024.1 YlmC/YmxH family sporulation protein [Caloramator sp. Dgby_cultured_2]
MGIRLSDILDLEIVNIYNGYKYGYIGDSELVFNKKTGEIVNVLVEDDKGRLLFFKGRDFIEIPWNTKIKIGEKTLIIDYKE